MLLVVLVVLVVVVLVMLSVVVVCRDVVPALVPEVAAGLPGLVGVEGLLGVTVFPDGFVVVLDAVWEGFVTATVVNFSPPLLPWLVLVVMAVGVTDCCPGLVASVKTFAVLVIPTLLACVTDTEVPEVLPGVEPAGGAGVAAFGVPAEPPLLPAPGSV